MRINIIIILVLLSFFSCKKNKTQHLVIEGTITDSNTGLAASNVLITIGYQEINNGSFSTAYKTLTSTTTDANGRYAITAEAPNAASYQYTITSSNYFGYSSTENGDNVSSSTSNTRNFSIESKAWFSVRIHNVSPSTVQDEIIYQGSTTSGCSSCCQSTPRILSGMSVDTTFTCLRKGGTVMNMNWTVTKNGVTNIYTNNAYCSPFDTTFYTIDY